MLASAVRASGIGVGHTRQAAVVHPEAAKVSSIAWLAGMYAPAQRLLLHLWYAVAVLSNVQLNSAAIKPACWFVARAQGALMACLLERASKLISSNLLAAGSQKGACTCPAAPQAVHSFSC